jgi:hypothetical protein
MPQFEVRGLAEEDARALLVSEVPFALDERVRDQIVAESRGNPLALLELPRGMSAAELAVGFGFLGAHTLSGRIEDSFRRRLEGLPEKARLFLLVAAAEPIGDPVLLWRRRASTTKWPVSWSARPAGRRPAAGRRCSRVSAARGRADRATRAAHGARFGRGAGESSGWRVRRRSPPSGRGGGRGARRVSARPSRPCARPRRLRVGSRRRCSPAHAEGRRAARAL